jgi:polysaccharide biosynthesis protein PslH
MADALLLCPEAPYPVAGGGPLRTVCILEYLSSRYTVDVIVFREPGAPHPRGAFPPGLVRDVAVVDLPYHSRSTVARGLRNLRRMLQGVPPLVDRFAGFSLPLNRDYAVGVVEHLWCAPYVDDLRRRCNRVVLNLHNIESVLLERCAGTERMPQRLMFRRFAAACRELERYLLPRFDQLLVTSAADQARVGGVVCPNTIPFVPLPDRVKREEIVFSGNLAYHPNTSAVAFFAARVWPLLREKHPDLVWKIVGRGQDSLRLPPDHRIHVTGPIADATGCLAESRAAVVPLLSGSGTRFKILESWAAGLPVISTTIGAEGLDAVPGEHLLLADSPVAFAEAITLVLNDFQRADYLGRRGRAFYEANFTWPSAWKRLESAGL